MQLLAGDLECSDDTNFATKCWKCLSCWSVIRTLRLEVFHADLSVLSHHKIDEASISNTL